MIQERTSKTLNGIAMIFVFLSIFLADILLLTVAIRTENPLLIIPFVIILVTTLVCLAGFFMIHPNEAKALTLFGRYQGSTRLQGLRWTNPFYMKHRISLRIRNFESDRLKVNELGGSPIEIATVVVWQVTDSAEALFEVDDYESFVRIQSEAALRQMATSYPYDPHSDDEIALRSHAGEISKHLREEVQARLDKAGVEVIEARISHLAYAPEIAGAMLQRQQAGAIIDARARIVEGAVGMVEAALTKLSADGIIDMDDERKAAMVSNLMVVLCGTHSPQPVVNTGTLY